MDIVLEFRQGDDFEDVSMFPVYDSQDAEMSNYSDHILKTKVNNLVKFYNNMTLTFGSVPNY